MSNLNIVIAFIYTTLWCVVFIGAKEYLSAIQLICAGVLGIVILYTKKSIDIWRINRDAKLRMCARYN